MALYTATITNAGRTMIANAQAGSGTIYPVNIHTGDGLLVQGDDPLTLPALKHEVQNYSIAGSNALTAYQATFQFLIDSSTVSTSYALNEIGLYCKLGTNGTPTLVYYAYVPGGGGDVVIPSGTSNATIDTNYLTITFSNATSCIATLTPAIPPALHAKTHLDYTDGSSPDPIPVASHAHVGLVPLTPADPTQVLIGSDPAAFGPVPLATLTKVGAIRALNGSIKYYLAGDGTWQPIVPLITNDTTLYVDPSYNNVTPNFSSIANAMNYLDGFQIANGVAITIIVNDATYLTSATLNIQHINGQQISIIDATDAPDVSFTVGTITGSAYAWSVQLTGVSNTAHIKLGTYLNIWNIGGGNIAQFLLTGCYRVTAVSGSTVTVLVPYRGSSFPAIGAVTGWAVPLNVILSMSQNQGVVIGNHGLAQMRGIAIVAGQAPSQALGVTGLEVSGDCSLSKIGISGFLPSPGYTTDGGYTGISIEGNCNCAAYKTCVTGTMYGFNSGDGANLDLMACATTHNSIYGIYAWAGNVSVDPDYITPVAGNSQTCSCGNGSNGIMANTASRIIAGGAYINGVLSFGVFMSAYNGAWALQLYNNSISTGYRNSDTSGNGGNYLYGNNNAAGDLFVGSLSIAGLQMVGSRIFNQASGVLTASGLINV